jgi:hypothetical protein
MHDILEPQVVRTQDVAKGCGEIRVAECRKTMAASVARMTLSVVPSWERNHTLEDYFWQPFSANVNLGGIYKHNRNVVLNGVNPAAFAALKTSAIGSESHRLFANWTNQYVKQILGNHGSPILARSNAV